MGDRCTDSRHSDLFGADWEIICTGSDGRHSQYHHDGYCRYSSVSCICEDGRKERFLEQRKLIDSGDHWERPFSRGGSFCEKEKAYGIPHHFISGLWISIQGAGGTDAAAYQSGYLSGWKGAHRGHIGQWEEYGR